MRKRCLGGCRSLISNGSYCHSCDPYDNPEWRTIRAAVIERDGRICQLGLTGCTITATTADHILPVALGGKTIMGNLRAACRTCNSMRRGAGNG